MPTLRLTGPEIMQFADLLRTAFSRVRFDEFLFYRLDKSVADYTGPADDYRTELRRVIDEANRLLWWHDLLREARNAVPGDPGLLDFSERFGLSPSAVQQTGSTTQAVAGRQLELAIKSTQTTYDVEPWKRLFGEITSRVCRVEYPENQERGTGFLIGPNAVLTNYHVIEPIDTGKIEPKHIVLRFDYKKQSDGVAVQSGVPYHLAHEWLFDSSRYSDRDSEVNPTADPNEDELDYAILRVDGSPGDDPVGGSTNDPKPTARRWLEVPVETPDLAPKSALYIVQHPDGKPMQVAIDSEAILGVNAKRTRVRYTTTTEPGSSGSPCFAADWQWVAVHHAGDPKYWKGQRAEYNQGIPVPAIRALLEKREKAAVLGGRI